MEGEGGRERLRGEQALLASGLVLRLTEALGNRVDLYGVTRRLSDQAYSKHEESYRGVGIGQTCTG
eukprot:3173236-Rhodomonas_salina.1